MRLHPLKSGRRRMAYAVKDDGALADLLAEIAGRLTRIEKKLDDALNAQPPRNERPMRGQTSAAVLVPQRL